jgi:hypothetical protein
VKEIIIGKWQRDIVDKQGMVSYRCLALHEQGDYWIYGPGVPSPPVYRAMPIYHAKDYKGIGP